MTYCSFKNFEFGGILCHHVLSVFLHKDCYQIPSLYLPPRWCREASLSEKELLVVDDENLVDKENMVDANVNYFYFSFFSQPHVSHHPYTYLLSSFMLLLLSVYPFSSFKIFMFSHTKLLAQLPCLLFFFFTAFFSNSVRLLLDFPSIDPFRLPQKNFMFSHMFLWVFVFGCTDVVVFL